MSKPTERLWVLSEGIEGTAILKPNMCQIAWFYPEETPTARLIVAAVNACIAISPSNPLAVAEGMGEVVSALAEALTGFNLLGKGQTEFAIKCRAALARIERKRE